ncbi:unnamed protein product, partial [Ectocarpus fasciculatus]
TGLSGESEFCVECQTIAASQPVVDCLSGIDAELGSCEFTDQAACCLSEASGIDCVADPTTVDFFDCLYDQLDLCDGGWTCS